MELLILFAVGIGAWFFFRRTESFQRNVPSSRSSEILSSKRPAFDPSRPWVGRQGEHLSHRHELSSDETRTWDEVFNRTLPDGLLYEIEYADSDGVVTKRVIEPRETHRIIYEDWGYITAYCRLRKSERHFHSGRIQDVRNLKTNRPIKDLWTHLRSRS